jgi:hypothetical protein
VVLALAAVGSARGLEPKVFAAIARFAGGAKDIAVKQSSESEKGMQTAGRGHASATRALVLSVLLTIPSSTAFAAPITWEWLGSVESSTIAGVAAGEDASLRMTFESTVPDLNASPTCGIYRAITSVEARFEGGQAYGYSGTSPLGFVEVQQGNNFGCGGTAISDPSLTFRFFGTGLGVGFFDIIAYFERGAPLPSDALPLVPPSPFGYQNAGFRVDLNDPTVPANAQAAIVRTQAVIPEPASLLLMGMGMAGAARFRRFRRPR